MILACDVIKNRHNNEDNHKNGDNTNNNVVISLYNYKQQYQHDKCYNKSNNSNLNESLNENHAQLLIILKGSNIIIIISIKIKHLNFKSIKERILQLAM